MAFSVKISLPQQKYEPWKVFFLTDRASRSKVDINPQGPPNIHQWEKQWKLDSSKFWTCFIDLHRTTWILAFLTSSFATLNGLKVFAKCKTRHINHLPGYPLIV
jgi:hypothetical protein